MAGHAQLKFVMMECSKTQIRLTRHSIKCQFCVLKNILILPAILAIVILNPLCFFPTKKCRNTSTVLYRSTRSLGMTCMLPLFVCWRTPVWLQYCHALQFHFSELWQTNHPKPLVYMHLSMFRPEGGDILGIRLPKQSLPSGISTKGLRRFSEIISKELCLNLKAYPGDVCYINCVTLVGNWFFPSSVEAVQFTIWPFSHCQFISAVCPVWSRVVESH